MRRDELDEYGMRSGAPTPSGSQHSGSLNKVSSPGATAKAGQQSVDTATKGVAAVQPSVAVKTKTEPVLPAKELELGQAVVDADGNEVGEVVSAKGDAPNTGQVVVKTATGDLVALDDTQEYTVAQTEETEKPLFKKIGRKGQRRSKVKKILKTPLNADAESNFGHQDRDHQVMSTLKKHHVNGAGRVMYGKGLDRLKRGEAAAVQVLVPMTDSKKPSRKRRRFESDFSKYADLPMLQLMETVQNINTGVLNKTHVIATNILIEDYYDKKDEAEEEVEEEFEIRNGRRFVKEGCVPDHSPVRALLELMAEPMLAGDLRKQMEAFFVVPDPSMIQEFRHVRGMNGDGADLRPVLTNFINMQLHPDLLSELKERMK